jgi:hypothetical protein
MRMVARRRKHKVGCREGEGEDLRWLQGDQSITMRIACINDHLC